MAAKKYYAVAVGRKPGIYIQWFGPGGAHEQVNGVANARFKGFPTMDAARAFIQEHALDQASPAASTSPQTKFPPGKKQKKSIFASQAPTADVQGQITIYTDGSSLGNPGPGGYGVVIPSGKGARELSGGFRRTTNNRMELLACIKGLEALETLSCVVIYSDSRYVVDGMTKGWAKKWKKNKWKKSTGEMALNIDLWSRLLDLCAYHTVRFVWVRGHAGTPGNERCDRLATTAAARSGLPADIGYETGSQVTACGP